MKNSKVYSQKVKKFYRILKRNYPKVDKMTFDEPADAIVYAIISENINETRAQFVNKRFSEYFVDLNDLRVSRSEEIVEILGKNTPITKDIASRLTRTLMAVFNQYHTVSLQALKKIGKRPAKHILEKLDGMSNFAINYCMLTALQAHAIPLTKKMIEYLKNNELVDPNADEQEIEGFLTRQIPAKNDFEFYALLRHESESVDSIIKKKTKKKTTRKTKTRKRKK